jgi:signal transduction histidine kinase/ActR/RegA family two-component response regulator
MKDQVLLITADASYRRSLVDYLRREQFQISAVDSPEEGANYLAAHPQISVIIIDLSIAHQRASTILDFIKTRSGTFRIIVLTSNDDPLDVEPANQYAAFNYLPKAEPSSNQAIRFSVAQALKDLELERLAHEIEQVRLLGEVGLFINSALDIDKVLSLTIQKMVDLMRAEVCMLFLRDEDDRIVLRQCIGIPMIPDAFYKLGEGVTGSVVETCKPMLLTTSDAQEDKYASYIRAFLAEKHGGPRQIESFMVVPIVAGSRTIGALQVINKANGLKYDEDDRDLFLTFAGYAGVAIANAQAFHVARDRLVIAERNAALSFLVKAVAHEINNTSGLIPANVAGIRAALGETSKDISDMLEVIEDAAAQATEFANELAGFSHTWAGWQRAVDINRVITSALDSLKGDLQRYGAATIELEISLCDRPLICELSTTSLGQIVRNIVINAFQAIGSKKTGTVHLSTSEGTGELAGTAVIQIQDNGPGIKREHMDRIFDPEFTTKPKGNGVGLWLVRTQLELVGGAIKVESEPGQGAKFIVTIPISPDQGGTLHGATHASAYR